MDINLKGLKVPERKQHVAQEVSMLKKKAQKYDRVQKYKLTVIYASVAALFIILFALQITVPFTTSNASGSQIKSAEHKTYEEYLNFNQPSPWYALGKSYLNKEQLTVLENYIEPVSMGAKWEFGGIESQHYMDRIFAFDVFFIMHSNGFDQYEYGLTYLPEIDSYALVDFIFQGYTKISTEEALLLKGDHLSLSEKVIGEAIDFVKAGLIGLIIYFYYVTASRLSPEARKSFNANPTLFNWVIKYIIFVFILFMIKVINIGFIGYVNGLLLLIVFAIFFFIRKFWGNTPRSWLEIPLSTAVYLLAMILYV